MDKIEIMDGIIDEILSEFKKIPIFQILGSINITDLFFLIET